MVTCDELDHAITRDKVPVLRYCCCSFNLFLMQYSYIYNTAAQQQLFCGACSAVEAVALLTSLKLPIAKCGLIEHHTCQRVTWDVLLVSSIW